MKQLTKKDRTMRALHRQAVDQFPIFMSSTPQFLQRAVHSGDQGATVLQAFEYTVKLDIDVVQVGHPSFYPVKIMELPMGAKYRDEFGRTHIISEYYDNFCAPFPLQSTNKNNLDEITQNWAHYVFPDPLDSRWYKNVDEIVIANNTLKDPLSVWGVINGPFEPTWQLLSDGWPAYYILARRRPQLALEIIEKVTDYCIKCGQEMIEHGVEAIRIGDDYALNEGLMASIDVWRKFVAPYQKKLVEGLKKKGGKDFPVILHSDGNIMSILSDLADSGLDAINPIQPDALDFGTVVKTIGSRMAMTAAFDLRYFLEPNSPENNLKMIKEVDRLFGIIDDFNSSHDKSEQTGFCIAPTHQVQPGSFVETYESWIKIVHSANEKRQNK